jgi:signal transduction histidine kinase
MNYLRPGQKGPTNTDLNTVINACLKVAAPLFREAKVTMHADLAATLPQTLCEPVLMRQAVMNLITNACHAMAPRDGERMLYLSSFTEEGMACIAIEDTGPGIPKNLWESVFDTFFSTKGQSGTGLGLGVVRNVVRRFNGSVKLESPKHGTGARFVLRLPIAQ